MTDPYSKARAHTQTLVNKFCLSLADLTTNEVIDLELQLKNYLAPIKQQLKVKVGDPAVQSIDLLKALLDRHAYDSSEHRELGTRIEKFIEEDVEKRQRKIDSIIQKSCRVKKLTLCLKLCNPYLTPNRLDLPSNDNYAIESDLNDNLRRKLLNLPRRQLEPPNRYKPYSSTLFTQAGFEPFIENSIYLSKHYYSCSSIKKLEHLRIQLEVQPQLIHLEMTTLGDINTSQAYEIIEKDFKIFQAELKKTNTILDKLKRAEYAELKGYITKISPQLDNNTAAKIVFHPDNYAVMKEIRRIEKRILTRKNRKKTDNVRKKLYVLSFFPNQINRNEFPSYAAPKRNNLISAFLAQEDQSIKDIIQSKKYSEYKKSKKQYEISVPKELIKKIKKLAKSNKITEQLLINIIFQDDHDKYQNFTDSLAKSLKENTQPPILLPETGNAKEQLSAEHIEQAIDVPASEEQQSAQQSEERHTHVNQASPARSRAHVTATIRKKKLIFPLPEKNTRELEQAMKKLTEAVEHIGKAGLDPQNNSVQQAVNSKDHLNTPQTTLSRKH